MTTAETPGSVRPRAVDDNRRSRPGAPATTQSTARFQALRDALSGRIPTLTADRREAVWREYAAAANPDTIRSLLAALDAAEAAVVALAEALRDVQDTEGGAYEHFDDHCTRETWCCAGHVDYALRDHSPAIAAAREAQP